MPPGLEPIRSERLGWWVLKAWVIQRAQERLIAGVAQDATEILHGNQLAIGSKRSRALSVGAFQKGTKKVWA